jgi:hypothetical protein
MKIFLYAIPAAVVSTLIYKAYHLLNHAVEMIARAMP